MLFGLNCTIVREIPCRVRRLFSSRPTKKDNDYMDCAPARLVHTDEAALVESTSCSGDYGSGVPGSRSSAGERLLHTQDVTGSIPVATTRKPPSRRYPRQLANELPKRTTIRGGATVPVVYFVQALALRLIKIGMTADLNDRLKTLQVGCPDRLSIIGAISDPNAAQLERRLHTRFREDHSHGEWFRPSAALLLFIEGHSIEVYRAEEKAALRAGLMATYGAKA